MRKEEYSTIRISDNTIGNMSNKIYRNIFYVSYWNHVMWTQCSFRYIYYIVGNKIGKPLTRIGVHFYIIKKWKIHKKYLITWFSFCHILCFLLLAWVRQKYGLGFPKLVLTTIKPLSYRNSLQKEPLVYFFSNTLENFF